jgi:hypothetical protein
MGSSQVLSGALLLALRLYSSNFEAVARLRNYCEKEEISGYSSQGGCSLKAMKSTKLRVVYLEKQYVTQNNAAIKQTNILTNNSYVFGRTCETAETAIPEW